MLGTSGTPSHQHRGQPALPQNLVHLDKAPKFLARSRSSDHKHGLVDGFKYPLVNSHSYGKSPFVIGKPSISMGHLYHGYVSHNQMVCFSFMMIQTDQHLVQGLEAC